MEYVEIELDGLVVVKRCPRFRTVTGETDFRSIRAHFAELGYIVGVYVRIC